MKCARSTASLQGGTCLAHGSDPSAVSPKYRLVWPPNLKQFQNDLSKWTVTSVAWLRGLKKRTRSNGKKEYSQDRGKGLYIQNKCSKLEPHTPFPPIILSRSGKMAFGQWDSAKGLALILWFLNDPQGCWGAIMGQCLTSYALQSPSIIHCKGRG